MNKAASSARRRARFYQTNVFDKYGDQADQEIARIIQQNAGNGPQASSGASSSRGNGAAAKSASAAKLM